MGVSEKNYHYTINQNVEHSSPWSDTVEYNDPNGMRYYVKRSCYALNPNCKPHSPNDTVLLFESKGGWNLFGRQELSSVISHRGKGCNILFNDGSIKFIRKKDLAALNWGDEQKQ